jgi:hypothetical protein
MGDYGSYFIHVGFRPMDINPSRTQVVPTILHSAGFQPHGHLILHCHSISPAFKPEITSKKNLGFSLISPSYKVIDSIPLRVSRNCVFI